MKSKLTSFILGLFIILGLTALNVNDSFAAKQRILFEEHTGTWCGPCGAYGKPAVKHITDKWSEDEVVYVSFHVGNDPFLLQDIYYVRQAYNVTYVPSGAFNRMGFNTQEGVSVFFGAGSWQGIADQVFDQILAEQPVVDVKTTYQINGSTLTANVNVEILQSMNAGDYRVGVYVLEDNLPYNQAGYSGQQPYVHNNVARAMVGGPWGLEGIIPNSPVVGETYSHTFTYQLDNSWDVNNIQIVGYSAVYASNSRQILNSVFGTEGAPVISVEAVGGQSSHEVIDASGDHTNSFVVTNPSNETKTYTFEAMTSNRTPGDWSAELVLPSETEKEGEKIQASEITLADGESATVGVKLMVGSNLGIGDGELAIGVKNDQTQVSRKVTALHSGVKNLSVTNDGTQDDEYTLSDNLTSIGYTGYFDMPIADFIAFDGDIPNLEMLVYSGGDGGEMPDEVASAIRDLNLNGTGVFISGTLLPLHMNDASPNLNQFFGANFIQPCFQGRNTNGRITLEGIDGDPITDGFSGTYNLEGYLTMHLRSINPQNCKMIVTHQGMDSTCAYRSEQNAGRAVVFGFTDKIVAGQAYNEIFENALRWIAGMGPQIAVNNSSLQFGQVYLDESSEETFSISNDGNEDLVVTELYMDNFFANIFKFPGTELPLTIAPGESEEITVEFTPSSKVVYDTEILVRSNSLSNDELSVTVRGEGIEDPSSVSDAKAMVSELTVGPNPVSSESIISYVLDGAESRMVNIDMIDASGNIVQNIVNETQAPGTYTLKLNANNVASGSYYLIMTTNGRNLTLPVAIIK